MLARRLLDSFSKLCVSAPATSLIRQNVALNQPTRFIHKHLLAEPGSRWKTIGNIWMVEIPEKYTIKKLPLYKLAGRDPVTGLFGWNPSNLTNDQYLFLLKGRVVVSTRGGGHKKKYRWVDMHRNGPKEGPPLVERVIAIKYDPCRTARIALVASGNNVRYIIATTTMKPGDLISTSGHIPRIASKKCYILYYGHIIIILVYNSSPKGRRCSSFRCFAIGDENMLCRTATWTGSNLCN